MKVYVVKCTELSSVRDEDLCTITEDYIFCIKQERVDAVLLCATLNSHVKVEYPYYSFQEYEVEA